MGNDFGEIDLSNISGVSTLTPAPTGVGGSPDVSMFTPTNTSAVKNATSQIQEVSNLVNSVLKAPGVQSLMDSVKKRLDGTNPARQVKNLGPITGKDLAIAGVSGTGDLEPTPHYYRTPESHPPQLPPPPSAVVEPDVPDTPAGPVSEAEAGSGRRKLTDEQLKEIYSTQAIIIREWLIWLEREYGQRYETNELIKLLDTNQKHKLMEKLTKLTLLAEKGKLEKTEMDSESYDPSELEDSLEDLKQEEEVTPYGNDREQTISVGNADEEVEGLPDTESSEGAREFNDPFGSEDK